MEDTIRGTIDNHKTYITTDNNIIRVTIIRVFGLIKQEYTSALSDLVIYKNKKAGTIKRGIWRFQLVHRNKPKIMTFKYNQKNQTQLDTLVSEILSYFREIKVQCQQCGHVHYYGEDDLKQAQYAALMNLSKGMMAIGGFLPLAFLPDKAVQDFKRCVSCGSRHVSFDEVLHKREPDSRSVVY